MYQSLGDHKFPRKFWVTVVTLILTVAAAASIAGVISNRSKKGGTERSVNAIQTEFDQDSIRPSLLPSETIEPTALFVSIPVPNPLPTSFPSQAPVTRTPTVSPTMERVDEGRMFRLRLHWEDGYLWQGREREKFWCLTCTFCRELNFRNDGKGCDSVEHCYEGDQIWIRDCATHGHVFQVANVNVYDQIRIYNADLCLERTQRHYITVERCDGSNAAQLWLPLNEHRFELRSADTTGDLEDYCGSQRHNPKDKEIVGFETCDDARQHNTSLWELYPI